MSSCLEIKAAERVSSQSRVSTIRILYYRPILDWVASLPQQNIFGEMSPAFETDLSQPAMAQAERHPDAPVPAANLDAEKGLETTPPLEDKDAHVRQITGFKVSAQASSDQQPLTLLDSGSCSSPAP